MIRAPRQSPAREAQHRTIDEALALAPNTAKTVRLSDGRAASTANIIRRCLRDARPQARSWIDIEITIAKIREKAADDAAPIKRIGIKHGDQPRAVIESTVKPTSFGALFARRLEATLRPSICSG